MSIRGEMAGLRQRIVREMARELPIPLECATEWDDMAELVADRIIALFHEALLSRAALQAFEFQTGYDYEGSIQDGLDAAFAAITEGRL